VGLRGCFLLLLLGLSSGLAAEPAPLGGPWKLESQRNGIALYTRRLGSSRIVPVKCVMSLPASIEEISAVLEDASRRGEWIDRFGASCLLERKSDYEQTEYLRMSLPWPFRDRSSLVKVLISVSDDLSTATIAASSVSCCARAGLSEGVRAEVFESTFEMRKMAGGTEVTALVFIDPKGDLPAWVVNLFTGAVSRRTLEGLRRQVARRLYGPDVLEALHQRILRYSRSGASAP
jgi:hypothetical protein